MKKPVLIGASLVLATSILGACGKESSTAASGENSNKQIALLQISNIKVNGVQLSEKDVTKYKKEYMSEDTYKKLNRDTQSVIKNMILKEALMKDLGVSQDDLDKEYQRSVESVKKDPQLVVSSKSMILYKSFSKAYAKKYLSDEATINKVADTLKGEDKKNFINNTAAVGYAKDEPGMYNLLENFYILYYVANKQKVTDVLKYQQDLLDKADVKGIKLSKLKADETIF
ncbi:hypothetical protein ABEX78_20640 [Priestia megaterium]